MYTYILDTTIADYSIISGRITNRVGLLWNNTSNKKQNAFLIRNIETKISGDWD